MNYLIVILIIKKMNQEKTSQDYSNLITEEFNEFRNSVERTLKNSLSEIFSELRNLEKKHEKDVKYYKDKFYRFIYIQILVNIVFAFSISFTLMTDLIKL